MFQRNVMKAFAGSLVLASLALTGCGTTTAGVDPYASGSDPYATGDTGGYTDPYGTGTGTGTGTGSYTDPYANGGMNTGTTLPGTVNGGIGLPTATNALTASLTVLKKGFLLGKTKVKVDVMNSSQAPASGTLTVTFTNNGKPTKNVQTKTVSIPAGGSQSFEFTGSMIGTDGAVADVVTDAPLTTGYGTNPGYGTGTGYGTTPGYGTGTGY